MQDYLNSFFKSNKIIKPRKYYLKYLQKKYDKYLIIYVGIKQKAAIATTSPNLNFVFIFIISSSYSMQTIAPSKI